MNLYKILAKNNISTENWSREKGTKTVEDLSTELKAGEATLEFINNCLTRVVKVVTIIVNVKLGDKIFTLVEDKQIFFTGAVRKRGLRNLAEKIKPNELPLMAARRALVEEIGLSSNQELIFEGEEELKSISPSYPGLESVYKTSKYRIILSASDLSSLKFTEVQPDKEKISFFTLEAEG